MGVVQLRWMEADSLRDKESTGWVFMWSGRLDIQAELPAAGRMGGEQGPCRSSAPRCERVTETWDFLPDKLFLNLHYFLQSV